MTHQHNIAVALCGLGCGAFVVGACANADDECGPHMAKVERVIDGDTIDLASGEIVRYLLIDTPETTGGKTDCFGDEAAAFTTDAVLGKTVALRYDEVCRDTYGRLLAYVEINGRDLNLLMVERGYACVRHTSPNGDDQVDEFTELERTARAGKIGLWGACDEVSCD